MHLPARRRNAATWWGAGALLHVAPLTATNRVYACVDGSCRQPGLLCMTAGKRGSRPFSEGWLMQYAQEQAFMRMCCGATVPACGDAKPVTSGVHRIGRRPGCCAPLLAGRGSKLAAAGDASELHPRQNAHLLQHRLACRVPKREQWARGAGRQPGYYARLLEAEGFDLAAREDAPEQRARQEFTRVRYRVNRLTATSLSWHGARPARRLCRAPATHQPAGCRQCTLIARHPRIRAARRVQ